MLVWSPAVLNMVVHGFLYPCRKILGLHFKIGNNYYLSHFPNSLFISEHGCAWLSSSLQENIRIALQNRQQLLPFTFSKFMIHIVIHVYRIWAVDAQYS
jgi:hypothetical protein